MELFPHNKEAYESAVRLFETENRVCIIRPTGTGKSVIIAAFVNDNPSKRHLLLAPGTHIQHEIQKHITNGKTAFATYIGLKMSNALFIPGSFDYIYLDEFHRLGAEVWGSAVERLLKHNPDAKVLGTSATHIRYLDDNRNMASEIFNDKIATQMSLNNAIANKILPPPIYVSALYSVKEEVQRMKKRILSARVKLEDKETLIRDLDSKIIDWGRSSGLDVVIKKHLGAERRRIIVFCKDWDHMVYAQKILDPIFETIYGRIESLSLHSKKKDAENEKYLKLFKGEDNRAIILYTKDKVNEGLHSKNCNTVILLRDTISPIVFYQQIGRAFSVKPANRPLILDLVNNFKNIHLDAFKHDFEQELNAHIKDNRVVSEEKTKTAIEFIDETQDIRLLFHSFEDTNDVLTDCLEKAKEYFKQHGHFYPTSKDNELKQWLLLQRNKYRMTRLGMEREAKLRAIGMDLDEEIPPIWMTFLFELKEWKKTHGMLPGSKENLSLSGWAIRQRGAFRAGKLSNRQIRMLQNLIRLEDDTRIKDRIERLIEYFKDGKVVPTKAIQHDLARVKVLNADKKLSEKTLTALRKANVPIDINVNHYRWLEMAKKVLEYYKENGVPPKRDRKSPIYNFCIIQRRYLEGEHPCAKFIESDTEAKWVYDELKKVISKLGAADWDDRYAELKKIEQAHGRISQKACGQQLASWIAIQQKAIKLGTLTPQKINMLLLIKGVKWYGRSKDGQEKVGSKKPPGI
jgi:superfamily II DNA/RNA helicase